MHRKYNSLKSRGNKKRAPNIRHSHQVGMAPDTSAKGSESCKQSAHYQANIVQTVGEITRRTWSRNLYASLELCQLLAVA